jgi:hypothetical protein
VPPATAVRGRSSIARLFSFPEAGECETHVCRSREIDGAVRRGRHGPRTEIEGARDDGTRLAPAVFLPSAEPFGRPIVVPALIADIGPRAPKRFATFFGSIANDNTRAAYQRACQNFFTWCDANGLDELAAIQPIHVGAYVNSMAGKFEKPTVKQHLAAICMPFDYLVVGQILAINSAHAVRGPKHSVKARQDAGVVGGAGAPAARQHRRLDRRRSARPRIDRADDLQLRPRRRGRRHARRGLFRRRQALAADVMLRDMDLTEISTQQLHQREGDCPRADWARARKSGPVFVPIDILI